MANFPFQVEFIDPAGRYVLARQLPPATPFRLMPGSRLGECEVTFASQPRALAQDGSPRLDIYGFRLRTPQAAARLAVGQLLDLRAEPAPLPRPTDEGNNPA